MAKPKGSPKSGGRKKGTPNKENKALREMIIDTLKNLGNEAWLQEQATKDPKTFISLLAKVLPTQVTGDGGGPVKGEWTIKVVEPE